MPIIAHGEEMSKTEDVGPSGAGLRVPDGVLTVMVVLLASSASFGLGYVTGEGKADEEPVRIEQGAASAESTQGLTAAVSAAPLTAKATVVKPAKAKKAEPVGTATEATGKYVASKKGTKYHLPTCSGAKTMSPENKIWFTTKEEAEAAGFTPAANCKGL